MFVARLGRTALRRAALAAPHQQARGVRVPLAGTRAVLSQAAAAAPTPSFCRALTTASAPDADDVGSMPLPPRPTVRQVLARAQEACDRGAEVYTTTSDTPLLTATRQCQQEHHKALLVADGDNVTGIFCETDVVLEYANSEADLSKLHVRDVMKTPILTASCDTLAHKAIAVLSDRKYQHLPVLSEDAVIAFDDAPVDGEVPLGFCEGVVNTTQLLAAHLKWLGKCDGAADAEGTVCQTSTLRNLLKVKRNAGTAHALVNTMLEDDITVAEVIEAMQANRVRSVFVSGPDNELVGILTTHDIVRYVLLEGRDPAKVLAKEIMTPDPKTLTLDKSVVDAANVLVKHPFHHLPVMQKGGGLAVGMLTMVDIAAALCPLRTPEGPKLESWSILSMLRRPARSVEAPVGGKAAESAAEARA